MDKLGWEILTTRPGGSSRNHCCSPLVTRAWSPPCSFAGSSSFAERSANGFSKAQSPNSFLVPCSLFNRDQPRVAFALGQGTNNAVIGVLMELIAEANTVDRRPLINPFVTIKLVVLYLPSGLLRPLNRAHSASVRPSLPPTSALRPLCRRDHSIPFHSIDLGMLWATCSSSG